MKKPVTILLIAILMISSVCIPVEAADKIVTCSGVWGEYPSEFTSDGYCMVSIDNSINYLNQWGEPLLPWITYTKGIDFSEGCTFVQQNGAFCLIDTSGAVQLPLSYEDVCESGYSDGLAAVCLNGQWSYIDRQGNVILTLDRGFSVKELHNGYAVLRNEQGLEQIHDVGNNSTLPASDWVKSIRGIGGGLFILTVGDPKSATNLTHLGLVAADGTILLPPEFNEIIPHESLGLIEAHTTKWYSGLDSHLIISGVLDYEGNFIFPLQSEIGIEVLSENSFIIEDISVFYGDHGLIDRDKNELLPQEYFEIYTSFSDQNVYLAFKNAEVGSGLWQLINTQGNVVHTLPEQFDDEFIMYLSDGLVVSHFYPDEPIQCFDRAGNLLMELPPLDGQMEHLFQEGGTWIHEADDEGNCMLKRVLNPLLEKKASDWAQATVEEAGKLGLITPSNQGYYTFRITRRRFAELAVGLVEQVLGETITPAPAERFTDTQDEWCRKAAAIGLINGINDGTAFSPNGYISREQLSLVLQRTISYLEERTGTTVLSGKADLSVYVDAEKVSPWAQDALAELVEAGILQGGADAVLNPHGSTTVEQAIALILRTYQQFEG